MDTFWLQIGTFSVSSLSLAYPVFLHVLGIHDVEILGINHSGKQAGPGIESTTSLKYFAFLFSTTASNKQLCLHILSGGK